MHVLYVYRTTIHHTRTMLPMARPLEPHRSHGTQKPMGLRMVLRVAGAGGRLLPMLPLPASPSIRSHSCGTGHVIANAISDRP